MNNHIAEETFNLLRAAAEKSTTQMLASAEGTLCNPEDLPADAEIAPGTRVYSAQPKLAAIEYIIDKTIGLPGAVVVPRTLPDPAKLENICSDMCTAVVASFKSGTDPLSPDGPFRSVLDARAQRRETASAVLAAALTHFESFLPTAITRMLELAKGVTICRDIRGKKTIITLPPSRRAIIYILRRAAGNAGGLSALLTEPQPVEAIPAEELTIERISTLTASESIACLKAEEAREAGAPEMPAKCKKAQARFEASLPEVIPYLSRLAEGAETIFQLEGSPMLIIKHAPDPHASRCLLSGIIGPTTRQILPEPIPSEEQQARITEKINSGDNAVRLHEIINAMTTILSNHPATPLQPEQTKQLIHRAILAS